MYTCAPKDVYKNVRNSVTLNSKKLETAQMSNNRMVNKLVVYSCSGILYGNENKTIAISNNVDKSKEQLLHC